MKIIFWNVDTQYDFMRNDESFKGKLPVPNAREIEGNLEKLTNFAKERKIQVVNTGDWHNSNSKEFSKNPDYKTTFPPHCLIRTKGAEFIPATNPENPYIIDWAAKGLDEDKLKITKDIILYKDAFDIFQGNKYSKEVVRIINPYKAIVYGVATNVCVDFAVRGLLAKGVGVYVPLDAIKELPKPPSEKTLNKWKNKGAILATTNQIIEYIKSNGLYT